MLWQGRAEFSSLARSTFHVRKLAIYFALLLGLRLTFKLGDGAGLASGLSGSAGLLGNTPSSVSVMRIGSTILRPTHLS